MDLVLQSPDLTDIAVEALQRACAARSIRRKPGAARLSEVADDDGGGTIRAAVAALAQEHACDAAFVDETFAQRDFRALAMDMDSTVITIECMDEIARYAGKGAEVAAITEAAMRGEIPDFSESLRRRAALLAGADAALIDRVIADRLRFSPGAPELIATARANGWKTLLVSGGFVQFTGHVQRALGIDVACANHIEIRDGRLTGQVSGPPENGGAIVDAGGKAAALQRLCAEIGCDTRQAIAVGDGANDLQMMRLAGLSVAYRAKPLVRSQADVAIQHAGLDGILNLFADRW